MRNIKQMYLNLRLPTNKTQQITSNLIEFHSCKRLPYSSRIIIQQIKPILLVYYIEVNCLLQLIYPSDNEQLKNYKWSDEDEEYICSTTTIQVDIGYHIEQDNFFYLIQSIY